MTRQPVYAQALVWTTAVTVLVVLGSVLAAKVGDEPAQPAPAPALADLVPPPPPPGLDAEDREAYWRAEIDRILTAPCPREPTGEASEIPSLRQVDPRWAGRVEAALRIHLDACS